MANSSGWVVWRENGDSNNEPAKHVVSRVMGLVVSGGKLGGLGHVSNGVRPVKRTRCTDPVR